MADKSQDSTESHYEKAGTTVLSEQSADPGVTSDIDTADWAALRAHLEQRLTGLRNWRESWWTQNWSDLAQYIEPRRSIWFTQSAGGLPTPNNMSRGKAINSSIVDPTATFAVRVCAGGLMSGLASPSRPWFKMVPSVRKMEIDSEGREWLDTVEDIIYTVLAGSNFYNSFAQECEDLVVFGTAPCIIYEDEKDLIRCYNPVIGEYYLASSSTMRVDGLYRSFVMTISQIVEFFGIENCTDDVRQMWQAKGTSLDVERIIGHSIEPNYAIGEKKVGQVPGNFAWREVYWLYGQGSKMPLSMRGFVDQPFTAARWSTQSNDAYGRSPGMDVLPDVIQLQVETMRKAEAIEKQVRPPLVADMTLKNQPSSSLPGHVTYVQNLGAGTGMRPMYEVNPDIRGMMEDIREIQGRIKTGLFNDVILMLSNLPKEKRTAYEVSELVAERLQVLGPVIEGLLNESLKPRLKRVFNIIKRKGMIPPLPDSLKGIPMDVEFISMLALAQKAAATGGIERISAFVGNLVAVYPEAKDNFDVDHAIREMNDLLGNPQQVLRGEDAVKKLRASQAQAIQKQTQQQEMAQGMQTVKTGADAANVLSNTNVGDGGKALSMLMGQGIGA